VRVCARALASGEAIAATLAAGRTVLVDGDLARASERAGLLRLADPAHRLLVEWCCDRGTAERDLGARFAGVAKRLLRCALLRYGEDRAIREPVGEVDEAPTVALRAEEPIDTQLARMCSILPTLSRPRAEGAPEPRGGVLLVEDDPSQRTLLAAVLRQLGCRVAVAKDADRALARLAERPRIDILLADYHLPGMSGVQLLRRAARCFPSVRGVLLTAYSDELACADARGALLVLKKPVHALDLLRVIDL
jgi:CheY-like chemotaxis protein